MIESFIENNFGPYVPVIAGKFDKPIVLSTSDIPDQTKPSFHITLKYSL